MNRYYLSIKSTSLAHYIGKGLILPSRFYKNRPVDIQTIEEDYLILSKNRFLNDSNSSIEIVLNSEEIKNIEDITGIFLYPNPIPISRIVKIYFTDEAQKQKTIFNINMGTGHIVEPISKVQSCEKIEQNL